MTNVNNALKILVAAGCDEETLRNLIKSASGKPVETSLSRRAQRDKKRGRDTRQKSGPISAAIETFAAIGVEPSAVYHELRDASSRQNIPAPPPRPSPPTLGPAALARLAAKPVINFERTAVQQASATLAHYGRDPEAVRGKEGEIRAQVNRLGRDAIDGAAHQGEVSLRIHRATLEIRDWLLREFSTSS